MSSGPERHVWRTTRVNTRRNASRTRVDAVLRAARVAAAADDAAAAGLSAGSTFGFATSTGGFGADVPRNLGACVAPRVARVVAFDDNVQIRYLPADEPEDDTHSDSAQNSASETCPACAAAAREEAGVRRIWKRGPKQVDELDRRKAKCTCQGRAYPEYSMDPTLPDDIGENLDDDDDCTDDYVLYENDDDVPDFRQERQVSPIGARAANSPARLMDADSSAEFPSLSSSPVKNFSPASSGIFHEPNSSIVPFALDEGIPDLTDITAFEPVTFGKATLERALIVDDELSFGGDAILDSDREQTEIRRAKDSILPTRNRQSDAKLKRPILSRRSVSSDNTKIEEVNQFPNAQTPLPLVSPSRRRASENDSKLSPAHSQHQNVNRAKPDSEEEPEIKSSPERELKSEPSLAPAKESLPPTKSKPAKEVLTPIKEDLQQPALIPPKRLSKSPSKGPSNIPLSPMAWPMPPKRSDVLSPATPKSPEPAKPKIPTSPQAWPMPPVNPSESPVKLLQPLTMRLQDMKRDQKLQKKKAEETTQVSQSSITNKAVAKEESPAKESSNSVAKLPSQPSSPRTPQKRIPPGAALMRTPSPPRSPSPVKEPEHPAAAVAALPPRPARRKSDIEAGMLTAGGSGHMRTLPAPTRLRFPRSASQSGSESSRIAALMSSEKPAAAGPRGRSALRKHKSNHERVLPPQQDTLRTARSMETVDSMSSLNPAEASIPRAARPLRGRPSRSRETSDARSVGISEGGTRSAWKLASRQSDFITVAAATGAAPPDLPPVPSAFALRGRSDSVTANTRALPPLPTSRTKSMKETKSTQDAGLSPRNRAHSDMATRAEEALGRTSSGGNGRLSRKKSTLTGASLRERRKSGPENAWREEKMSPRRASAFQSVPTQPTPPIPERASSDLTGDSLARLRLKLIPSTKGKAVSRFSNMSDLNGHEWSSNDGREDANEADNFWHDDEKLLPKSDKMPVDETDSILERIARHRETEDGQELRSVSKEKEISHLTPTSPSTPPAESEQVASPTASIASSAELLVGNSERAVAPPAAPQTLLAKSVDLSKDTAAFKLPPPASGAVPPSPGAAELSNTRTLSINGVFEPAMVAPRPPLAPPVEPLVDLSQITPVAARAHRASKSLMDQRLPPSDAPGRLRFRGRRRAAAEAAAALTPRVLSDDHAFGSTLLEEGSHAGSDILSADYYARLAQHRASERSFGAFVRDGSFCSTDFRKGFADRREEFSAGKGSSSAGVRKILPLRSLKSTVVRLMRGASAAPALEKELPRVVESPSTSASDSTRASSQTHSEVDIPVATATATRALSDADVTLLARSARRMPV